MLAVAKKEIKMYFYSPIAYVLIGLFALVISINFMPYLAIRYGEFTPMLNSLSSSLIVLIPILTMRLFSEDRKSGAETLLLASPTSLTSIVIGKYLAALFMFVLMMLVSMIYPFMQVIFGGGITAHLVGGYIGFFLLGAAFVSVGLLASSITENQIIAAIVGFVCLIVVWAADTMSSMLGGVAGIILAWFSLLTRYQEFTRGILGLTPTVYFISFTAFFIFLTIRVIDRRRWSQR